ncbi:MAG: MarR family transcriptional regulator [Geminicoccaceae bacterium]
MPGMTMQPAAPSLGFLLNDSARLLRRRFDQKARHLGLTRAQWQVLAHLARHEGIRQVALADLLEIEPITLCRLVDRMEEGGWIERRADPDDRRARLLFMTAKAWPMIADMRALAEEIYAEALAGLSAEERAGLIRTLEHMRANLAELRAEPAGAVA